MTGNAVDANPFLLFRLVEPVADAFPFVDPRAIGHAMDQEAVYVIGVKAFAMAIDRAQHVLGLAPDFGLDIQFLTRQTIDRFAHPSEGGVTLGAIKVRDSVVVRVVNQFDPLLLAEDDLVLAVVDPGPDAQPAQLHATLAQRDLVRGGALDDRGARIAHGPRRQGRGGAREGSGCANELTTTDRLQFHKSISIVGSARFRSVASNYAHGTARRNVKFATLNTIRVFK